MINATTSIVGIIGSTAGPIILLKTSVDLIIPWEAIVALALVLAIIPVLVVTLNNRRGNR